MKIKKIEIIKKESYEDVFDLTVKNKENAQNFLVKGSIFIKNCGPACHDSIIDKGSSTVFCEGVPLARQGDPLSCSVIDCVDAHSPNVNAGG